MPGDPATENLLGQCQRQIEAQADSPRN